MMIGVGAPSVFPLAVDSSNRFLKQANGTPWPLLGRTSWALISLTQANYQSFIDDTATRGFNAIEVAIPHRWAVTNQAPYANNGSHLPFATKVGGGSYTGAIGEAPDFTDPVEAYWSFADGLIDYAATKSMAVMVFPCYTGASGANGIEGWIDHMVTNGTTRMGTYGTWIGNRWKSKSNLIWMLSGDRGSGGGAYSAGEQSVVNAFTDALVAVSGKSSNIYSAENSSNSISTDCNATSVANAINLNGAYSWDGSIAAQAAAGYAYSPTLPTICLEEPYDEEGPDGNNFNTNATQPVRRFVLRAWLHGATAGYVQGNGYVWPFKSSPVNYADHLNTTNTQALAVLNTFWKSIAWQTLVPSDSIVTAGLGTVDASDYCPAAKNSAGTLCVVYAGPSHASTITLNLSSMSGTSTWTKLDPVNGATTSLGTKAASTGQSFSSLGTNSGGDGDWILYGTV